MTARKSSRDSREARWEGSVAEIGAVDRPRAVGGVS